MTSSISLYSENDNALVEPVLDRSEQWRAKTVPFAKDGSRVVREVYTTEVGGVDNAIIAGAASYVLHTGSSWHGPIGSAKVIVKFMPATEVHVPLVPKMIQKNDRDANVLNHLTKPGGLLVFSKLVPKADGDSLVFQAANLKPTVDDDIYVLYRYPETILKEMRQKYDRAQKKGRG